MAEDETWVTEPDPLDPTRLTTKRLPPNYHYGGLSEESYTRQHFGPDRDTYAINQSWGGGVTARRRWYHSKVFDNWFVKLLYMGLWGCAIWSLPFGFVELAAHRTLLGVGLLLWPVALVFAARRSS